MLCNPHKYLAVVAVHGDAELPTDPPADQVEVLRSDCSILIRVENIENGRDVPILNVVESRSHDRLFHGPVENLA